MWIVSCSEKLKELRAEFFSIEKSIFVIGQSKLRNVAPASGLSSASGAEVFREVFPGGAKLGFWIRLPKQRVWTCGTHCPDTTLPQLTVYCFALQEHRLGSVRSVMEDIKLADNLSWNDFQRAPAVRGRAQTEMSRLWKEYREGGCDGQQLGPAPRTHILLEARHWFRPLY